MALFVLSLCPFDISVGVGAFVIGLGQISSFLSLSVVILSHTLFSFFYILLRLTGLMFMHARMQAWSVGPTLVLVTANIRPSLMSPLAEPLVHILHS